MVTKHEISEYYADPAVRAAILAQIKDRPVLAIQSRPEQDIKRRNDPAGSPIRILQARNNAKDKSDLAWYTERLFSEFHPTVGKKTRRVWVDLDPGPDRDFESLKPVAVEVEKALKKLPAIKDTQINYSGGRGLHVHGHLRRKTPTDTARKSLTEHLESLKIPGAVFRKPQGNEIRLDTSTLKNKGSLRASYSLNSATGRVNVPLTERELRGFKPEHADVRRILKAKEFAPGIPRSRRTYPLPSNAEQKQWIMAIQEHNAKRAGKHWDLRLVDPETGYAHSWAVPKARFPAGSERLLAVHTPTHTENYALNFGDLEERTIGKGYGKGTVKIVHKEPVRVKEIAGNKVQIERILDSAAGDLKLFRTKGDKWMLQEKTARDRGYLDALAKIGVAPMVPATEGKIEENGVTDQNTPAGELASLLATMNHPDYSSRASGKSKKEPNIVEERLNRDVQWSSPQDIPAGFMEGSSPILPGGGY